MTAAMRFEGKVAFITGGAVGFGRAFAKALVAEGCAVAIADIDLAMAKETAASLAADGHSAIAVACDVADDAQVVEAVDTTVAQLGGVDILINNAGRHLTHYSQPFSVLPRKDVREMFEVNVMGAINCTLACQNPMRARGGGVILNIASIAGHLGTSPYGVSKLAVRGLTVAFAHELAGDAIRVNAISPGLMATEAAMVDLPADMVEDFVQNRQLVRRLGVMDDIVNAMLFLCSEDSGFVTGETLKVSGGYPLEV
jgi:NAD(P)-dependent dehydrogenase (short-subunit alcohol dehydrogenase family)